MGFEAGTDHAGTRASCVVPLRAGYGDERHFRLLMPRSTHISLIERVEESPIGRGAEFITYLENLPFDEAERIDVERMEQAIEEECERIEPC